MAGPVGKDYSTPEGLKYMNPTLVANSRVTCSQQTNPTKICDSVSQLILSAMKNIQSRPRTTSDGEINATALTSANDMRTLI